MALDDDIKVLAAVSLFEELTGEQLRLIAFGAENMRLPAGRDLYREGSPADCAFIIGSGEVDLVALRDGEKRYLRTAGPGAILGETALIAPVNRSTGAVSRTQCELIRINRTLFRRILEEYPDVASRLHSRFVRELETLVRDVTRVQSRFDG